MFDEKITISVIMAAYNSDDCISRAIESVQIQSFSNWELICVDDGSTDGTRSIIQSFADRDNRIKLISQANAGPAEARRKGYIAGIGDYFIMLDSDDWFGPNALEKLLTEAQRTGANGVVCRAMVLTPETNDWVCFHEQRGTMLGLHLTGKEAFVLTFPWKIHGIALWQKRIVKSVAINPRNIINSFNADEYVTRILLLECDFVIIGSGEYFIYPRQGSITRGRSWRQFLSLQTDRHLTDLAIASGMSSRVIQTVLKLQRRNLLIYASRFARYGGDGQNRAAFREIRAGLFHYLRSARRIEGPLASITIIPEVLKHTLRSFIGRFAVLRNIYYKIRS